MAGGWGLARLPRPGNLGELPRRQQSLTTSPGRGVNIFESLLVKERISMFMRRAPRMLDPVRLVGRSTKDCSRARFVLGEAM
jgi:hypothetical protein